MKLTKLVINNFRKLTNNVTIDISNETIIVGKNNTGKTSVSEVLTKFLTMSKTFRFEDFSSYIVTEGNLENLKVKFESFGEVLSEENIIELKEAFPKIHLKIFIELEDEDNLYKIKPLIYEFDNNKELILSLNFECENPKNLFQEYKDYNNKIRNNSDLEEIGFFEFFKREFSKFYSKNAYVTKPDKEYLHHVEIKEIINLFNIGLITAQREVDDISDQNGQNISNSIWAYYQNLKKDKDSLNQEDAFKGSIETIKTNLNKEYSEMFSDLLLVINKNILENPSHLIEITSEFAIEDVLKKNSKIKYKVDNLTMPESYNGLGFSNLMYMLIQLITFIDNAKKEEKLFNLLFLEEPESHLHPQMQSTFLKKFDELLQEIENRYIVLTTHSSYLLQSSDLRSVRYFTESNQSVEVRSLQAFFVDEKFSGFENFMKKYLKINTCDLFFADKAILVEGTVERMLINVLIQKFDEEQNKELSKQHLTIVEVGGAYAHIFNDLLEFLNLKTLIITDIDSVTGPKNKACKCDLTIDNKVKTSNAVIKNWDAFKDYVPFIGDIVRECANNEILIEKTDTGIEKKMLTFQRPLNGELYWGRTFEEQFLIENADQKIIEYSIALKEAIDKSDVVGILNTEDQSLDKTVLRENVFEIVNKIDKTNFALDLLASNDWIIPTYIKEGLIWLEQ